MRFTAGDIAAHLGGKVIGDRTMPLTGFQAADRARDGDLTFAENRTFFERAEQSAASAIIVDKNFNQRVWWGDTDWNAEMVLEDILYLVGE